MKIVLFGSEGRLGRSILIKHPEVTGYGMSYDIRDFDQVSAVLKEERPDIVINCAAVTDVEYCESHKEECWNVNCKAVETLLRASGGVKANLVHFSSNYALDPVNEYGISKRESEKVVGKRGLVLRTDLYDMHTFLVEKLLGTIENVIAYSDKFYNPISMVGLVEALFGMLKMKGLYNIGTKERISMADFGKTFCKVFGLNENRVFPAPSSDEKKSVKRPKEMYLEPYNNLSIKEDLKRFKNELGM